MHRLRWIDGDHDVRAVVVRTEIACYLPTAGTDEDPQRTPIAWKPVKAKPAVTVSQRPASDKGDLDTCVSDRDAIGRSDDTGETAKGSWLDNQGMQDRLDFDLMPSARWNIDPETRLRRDVKCLPQRERRRVEIDFQSRLIHDREAQIDEQGFSVRAIVSARSDEV